MSAENCPMCAAGVCSAHRPAPDDLDAVEERWRGFMRAHGGASPEFKQWAFADIAALIAELRAHRAMEERLMPFVDRFRKRHAEWERTYAAGSDDAALHGRMGHAAYELACEYEREVLDARRRG